MRKLHQDQACNAASQRHDDVRKHLIQAMKTMRILPLKPGDRPQKTASSWVEFSQETPFLAGHERRPIRQKVTAKQINHMEYWLDAALSLDVGVRRIVLARACKISWRRLEEIDGRSHTTLRKVERRALDDLQGHLLKGCSILPADFYL